MPEPDRFLARTPRKESGPVVNQGRNANPALVWIDQLDAEHFQLSQRIEQVLLDGGYFFADLVAAGTFRPGEGAPLAVEAILFRLKLGEVLLPRQQIVDDGSKEAEHAIGSRQVDDHLVPARLLRSPVRHVFRGAAHLLYLPLDRWPRR